ncbi:hypothetical protein LY76DRAFT_31443 [Colletotrichum caudatum]|nr:hypothetical protein LY76DRAFT_31443 [Colletotrichum caudatum]
MPSSTYPAWSMDPDCVYSNMPHYCTAPRHRAASVESWRVGAAVAIKQSTESVSARSIIGDISWIPHGCAAELHILRPDDHATRRVYAVDYCCRSKTDQRPSHLLPGLFSASCGWSMHDIHRQLFGKENVVAI